MFIKRLLAVVVVFFATVGIAVAQSKVDRSELVGEMDAIRAEIAATSMAPKAAGGGDDPDSFGRNVKFDGLMQSGWVSFLDDCTPIPGDPPPEPNDRCVVLNAAPASTTFDLPDIGTLVIPGNSAKSLLCHWLSPIAFYRLENTTGAFHPNATMRLTPYVIIESEVLDDPALIDPTTGLPFNGQLETGFSATYQDSQSMDPGHSATRRFSESRVCISGFLSKRALVSSFGLTDAQAAEVFKKDVTLRFGLRGNATLVSTGIVTYGLRVVGD
jgi:hypothetical protein